MIGLPRTSRDPIREFFVARFERQGVMTRRRAPVDLDAT